MNRSIVFRRGESRKIKRVWLFTWEYAGEHILVNDRFVAIISSRYEDRKISKILEQYFVSDFLALHEQVAFVKERSSCPYKVQYSTISIPEQVQKKSSLPSKIPFSDSMIIGGNPWLWARIVDDFETWIDDNEVEHLKWKERENISLENGTIKYDLLERSLLR